jgi:hypothetical protein
MRPWLLGYDAAQRPLLLDPEDAKAHWITNGSSGSGKSKFLEGVMRQFLQTGQGFALAESHGPLCDDIIAYCAHRALDREIIFLDLSNPQTVVSFNPFQRAPEADVSVQVDRRISAVMAAWGVQNTDQTPTLARVLRLVFTIMLEQNLGLSQIQHLITFNAHEIRGALIERLSSPLIQKEWRELQAMKAKDWRDETLSAKNRLFKFLTSQTLCRFMGLPGRTINLREVMDQGKVLIVKAAPSDHLSHENARAFLALLVNEFFECATRRERDDLGRDPRPYYLILDEFQDYFSPELATMLDQVRKRSLFLLLSHQRFGQLDENMIDAVLCNCRIKATFGGLPVKSARLMAEELFIGELDPKKIKVAIYQTKFWPQYRRDKVYTSGTSHTSSSGSTHTSTSGSFNGTSAADSFFQPNDWFATAQPTGYTEGSSSGNNSASSSGYSDTEAYGDSESVADIPILIPVPFQELSSVQYYTTEEQLTELTAALKEQFPRHCFIKIQGEKTQPMLVPFIEPIRSFRDSEENLKWYRDQQNEKQHALPAAEVDRLINEEEIALLQATSTQAGRAQSRRLDSAALKGAAVRASTKGRAKARVEHSIWNRGARNDKSLGPDQLNLAIGEKDE